MVGFNKMTNLIPLPIYIGFFVWGVIALIYHIVLDAYHKGWMEGYDQGIEDSNFDRTFYQKNQIKLKRVK